MKNLLLGKFKKESSAPVLLEREELDYEIVFNVAGVSYSNPNGVSRQKIISGMSTNDLVSMVREPGNQFDKNAIAIFFAGAQIGYLPKEISCRVTDFAFSPISGAVLSVGSAAAGLLGVRVKFQLPGRAINTNYSSLGLKKAVSSGVDFKAAYEKATQGW